MARIFRTTVLGGVLFLLPVIVIFVILRQAVALIKPAMAPLVSRFPERPIAGVSVATLAAVAALVVICFLAGLIARSGPARKVTGLLEWTLLAQLPGYMLVKSFFTGVAQFGDAEGGVSTVLARIEDAWQLAFLVETHDDGMRTVFVPGAPSPTSGSVYYLSADRVRPVDIPIQQAVGTIRRLGAGSEDLLRGKLGEPAPVSSPRA
jgi:uncharacterized membrane protein